MVFGGYVSGAEVRGRHGGFFKGLEEGLYCFPGFFEGLGQGFRQGAVLGEGLLQAAEAGFVDLDAEGGEEFGVWRCLSPLLRGWTVRDGSADPSVGGPAKPSLRSTCVLDQRDLVRVIHGSAGPDPSDPECVEEVVEGVGTVPELVLAPEAVYYREEGEFIRKIRRTVQRACSPGGGFPSSPPKKPSSVQSTSSTVRRRHAAGSCSSSM